MSLFRFIRLRWLIRRAGADFYHSERHRLLSEAYLDRSLASLDVVDAILKAERAALTHRV